MAKNKIKELPQVLILKRTYTQRFPNGQQVALYHSDALDQYITIPLDGSQVSTTVESIISSLNTISENDVIETVLFNDLSELNINKECADIILNYLTIKEEVKEYISESDKTFLQILEEAVQNSQQDSEEESEAKQELEQ